MEQYRLGEMEQRFADLIWEHAPISSGQLAKLAAEAFAWKRTTTYTMLKRLCDRKIFSNQNGTVYALMTKEEFTAGQGEQFLNEHFDGSLPLFIAAFTRRKRLSQKEVAELKRLIDEYGEGDDEWNR